MVSAADGEFTYKPLHNFTLYSNFPPFCLALLSVYFLGCSMDITSIFITFCLDVTLLHVPLILHILVIICFRLGSC
jgi:hypothetical protein